MTKLQTRAIAAMAASLMLSGAAIAQTQPQTAQQQGGPAQATPPAISMSQAIDTASKAVGGNVTNAGLSDEAGPVAWEIELAQVDGTVRTVLVDGQTGAVDQTSAMDDRRGSDNDHHDRGDDHHDGDHHEEESGEDAN